MMFAETERLRLRQLRREDLPRYAALIGDWDVAQWLTLVPYPYFMKDAEAFFTRMDEAYRAGKPELFLITDKNSGDIMGGVGLHPAKSPEQAHDHSIAEVGYWLGKPFWGRGVMTEAVKAVLSIGFARPELQRIMAITDPSNTASKNVLQKAGLRFLGYEPRREIELRGSDKIACWEILRSEFLPKVTP